MRADLRFIELDNAIERSGFDIPLFDQNRLDRTNPQLHLRKMGGLIMIVIVCSHRRDTTNYGLSGQISERSTLETIGTTGTIEPASLRYMQSDGAPHSADQVKNCHRKPRTIPLDLKIRMWYQNRRGL